MDQALTERYSWSTKDTKGYIDAYQYVYNIDIDSEYP